MAAVQHVRRARAATARIIASGAHQPRSSLPAITCRRLDGYAGSVQIDADEVVETQWVQLPQLRAHAEAHPGEYTQVGRVLWMTGGEALEGCGGRWLGGVLRL